MDDKAIQSWGVLRNYRECQSQLYSSLLLEVLEIPFHSILMSCWIIKSCVFQCTTSPEALLPASVSHYNIQACRARTIHTLHPPNSSTSTPTPATPILQETDRVPLILLLLLLYLSKTLLWEKNNYSLEDNIALRKLLADADVLTSGQHSQNRGGPDRPGATRSRNVKVEVFSTDERSREEGEREQEEKKRAQNSIKQVRSAA